MNFGKSTALLQVAHNDGEHGRAVWIPTSALDEELKTQCGACFYADALR